MPADALLPGRGVVVEELDGRACLYSPQTEQVLLLDDAGSLVWHLAGSGTTRAALLDDLVVVTGRPPAEVAPSLDALLDLLLSAGALVRR